MLFYYIRVIYSVTVAVTVFEPVCVELAEPIVLLFSFWISISMKGASAALVAFTVIVPPVGYIRTLFTVPSIVVEPSGIVN